MVSGSTPAPSHPTGLGVAGGDRIFPTVGPPPLAVGSVWMVVDPSPMDVVVPSPMDVVVPSPMDVVVPSPMDVVVPSPMDVVVPSPMEDT